MRTLYSVNGQRNLTSVGTASTDDRGEYRIFWVPAGRYVLSVAGVGSSGSFMFTGEPGQILSRGAPNVFADRTFPVTYYPGTLDPSRASVLDLQPGAEMSAVDVVLSQPASYSIRGRVVDGATGKAPQSASVSIAPRQESGTVGGTISGPATPSTVNYNNATGTFELRNVIPGTYWLRASSSTDLNEPVNLNVATTARTAMDCSTAFS